MTFQCLTTVTAIRFSLLIGLNGWIDIHFDYNLSQPVDIPRAQKDRGFHSVQFGRSFHPIQGQCDSAFEGSRGGLSCPA
ncbi:hypothetical protein DSTSK_08490 [Desulforhabdus sp. TSK]|nr:hypothetical protein DSTSK_08490 [Desulforhabdus sp. TSK]